MRNGNRTPHPGIRRDGKDQYTVRVTTRDPTTGRQRERERKVTGTLPEAIKVREELRAELATEPDENAARVVVKQNRNGETVGDYAKRWLVHLTRTGRNRPHVVKGKVDILERFILPFIGDMPVRDVQRAHVVAWMESLGDMRHDGKPYAKATLKGAWRTMRTLLKDALVLCDLDKDPTMGVRFYVRGNDEKPKDVLTQDELVRLLEGAAPESPDVRAMVWLGFTTGMRFGELSALTWEDIDEALGLIHVRRSQVNGNVGKTKTNTARSVPLHPTVKAILDEHRLWLSQRLPGHPLVFPSRTGTYRSSGVLKNPLKRAAERGGVEKHVSAHTMRRTFNNLARQAAGEIVTRAMTGHATQAMTEHYSDVTVEEKHRALAAALGVLEKAPAGVGRWGATEIPVNPSTKRLEGKEKPPTQRGFAWRARNDSNVRPSDS